MLIQKQGVTSAATVDCGRWSSVLHSLNVLAVIANPTAAQVIWNNLDNDESWFDLSTNWNGHSNPGPTDTAQFNLSFPYEVWWDHLTPTGTPAVGFLHVLAGDVTFLNLELTKQWALAINGAGGAGAYSDFSISGAGTRLINSGIHLHSSGGAQIVDGAALTIDGAPARGSRLTVDGSVGFQVDGTLSVNSGGVVSSNHGDIARLSGSTGVATITGAGSQWHNSGALSVGYFGNGTLNVEAGGQIASNAGWIGGGNSSTGVATVTGAGSQWNCTGNLVVPGIGDGTLHVEAGGVVSSSYGYIGGNHFTHRGVVTVTGAGSQWNSSGNVRVGQFGSGTVNVQDGGLVEVVGTLWNWNTGTVTLDGGSIVADRFLNTEGGTFDFVAGALTINSGLTIGSDPAGVFVSSFTVNPEHAIATSGTTTISPSRSLKLNGGSLTTHSLAVDGFFNFDRGTLALTGGTITGLSRLSVPTAGEFRAAGVYNLPVAASTGSTITATGNLTLGDATLSNGFYANGAVVIDTHTVTLLDVNDVVLDSGAFVTLGNGSEGTLVAANGLTLDFGGNITGYGAVDTPNSAATPLINNGHIAGDSLAEPVTLTGYVTGVGTCDYCNIAGTDAPGLSPAAVNRGSVAYNGALEIELGGTSPGSGYDQLNHILGAGIADLGGTLEVRLIDGFVPSAGDTFEILSAANILDTFDTLNLPALPGDLLWYVNYGATSVELVSTYGADFDEDGDVDGDDLARWQAGYATGNAHLTGDADGDGDSDGWDFLNWQRQVDYGAGVPLAAATIPDPSTLALLAFAVIAVMPVGSRWWLERARPGSPVRTACRCEQSALSER